MKRNLVWLGPIVVLTIALPTAASEPVTDSVSGSPSVSLDGVVEAPAAGAELPQPASSLTEAEVTEWLGRYPRKQPSEAPYIHGRLDEDEFDSEELGRNIAQLAPGGLSPVEIVKLADAAGGREVLGYYLHQVTPDLLGLLADDCESCQDELRAYAQAIKDHDQLERLSAMFSGDDGDQQRARKSIRGLNILPSEVTTLDRNLFATEDPAYDCVVKCLLPDVEQYFREPNSYGAQVTAELAGRRYVERPHAVFIKDNSGRVHMVMAGEGSLERNQLIAALSAAGDTLEFIETRDQFNLSVSTIRVGDRSFAASVLTDNSHSDIHARSLNNHWFLFQSPAEYKAEKRRFRAVTKGL